MRNCAHSRGTKLSMDNKKLGVNMRSYSYSSFHTPLRSGQELHWQDTKTVTRLCASSPLSCMMKGSGFSVWHTQVLDRWAFVSFFKLSASFCPLSFNLVNFCQASFCLCPINHVHDLYVWRSPVQSEPALAPLLVSLSWHELSICSCCCFCVTVMTWTFYLLLLKLFIKKKRKKKKLL